MIYIGIDPGKKGGIAWIQDGKPCAEKMPSTLKDLWDLIESIVFGITKDDRQTQCKAVLEYVASSPQQGVVSAFTFGNGYGHLEMALTAAGVPFERVTPGIWQKAMKCLTGGEKNISKAKAQELFPSIKITHSIADALLIAAFCERR